METYERQVILPPSPSAGLRLRARWARSLTAARVGFQRLLRQVQRSLQAQPLRLPASSCGLADRSPPIRVSAILAFLGRSRGPALSRVTTALARAAVPTVVMGKRAG